MKEGGSFDRAIPFIHFHYGLSREGFLKEKDEVLNDWSHFAGVSGREKGIADDDGFDFLNLHDIPNPLKSHLIMGRGETEIFKKGNEKPAAGNGGSD